MTDQEDIMNNMENEKRSFVIAFSVIVVAMVILLPLPTILLDILIAANLILALLILLAVLCIRKTKNLSLVPTCLLVSSLFSLAVHISSARLILTKGVAFDGRIIRAVSSLIIGSGEFVNLIAMFSIFLVIAFILLVIAKSAARVSEIAVRFTLDSLPGKQMAIDAEYSSGAIDQGETIALKEALHKESDFYGALDGASKFIIGNAKFSIFFILLSIVGGILIDILFRGEAFIDAVKTYVPLAIGNGILSLLSVLLLSAAMGIMVTRAAASERIAEIEPPEPLSLELGYGLIPLVDKGKGSELLERIQEMRRGIELEMGIVIPKIRIIDNMLLYSGEYCFKIWGAEVGKGTIRMGSCLCINPGTVKGDLTGEEATDPVSGLPAFWVVEDARDEAERLGYRVINPSLVIVSHLMEIIKSHGTEISKLHN